jgi:hypothetical protein
MIRFGFYRLLSNLIGNAAYTADLSLVSKPSAPLSW